MLTIMVDSVCQCLPKGWWSRYVLVWSVEVQCSLNWRPLRTYLHWFVVMYTWWKTATSSGQILYIAPLTAADTPSVALLPSSVRIHHYIWWLMQSTTYSSITSTHWYIYLTYIPFCSVSFCSLLSPNLTNHIMNYWHESITNRLYFLFGVLSFFKIMYVIADTRSLVSADFFLDSDSDLSLLRFRVV